jgi:hypothetical protein
MLAAFPEVSDAELLRVLEQGGTPFVSLIVDHGLGPLWHSRVGRDEFHASRMSAEALFLAQQQALEEIDTVLEEAGIQYAVIKGAASRELLYDNPALRACHDLDLLVRREDRVHAATALVSASFVAFPEADSISRELLLSRGPVNIDLHWELLREGRLRRDCTDDMLERRRRSGGLWMLSPEDSFFLLVVHPAFAKHLGGWEMGLHRVADIVAWLRTQSFDWPAVRTLLEQSGVRTAAWATLRWVDLLTNPNPVNGLDAMLSDISPARVRRAWLDKWLSSNLSARTSDANWARLLLFSLFLHDTPRDSVRALTGRHRARKRSDADLAVFQDLTGEQTSV